MCSCHGDDTDDDADLHGAGHVVLGAVWTLEGAAHLADVQGEQTVRGVHRGVVPS